ncbi:cell division protein FtsL [Reinekea marinisedimentorum]|uniref:Cell division protein FtsL n=1 Tax=Reinekea marinisedimentorum TaxID=230495 RepID=A0A4R3I9H1_9GAMM|nr:cell division protein FtsL [Reinekea marinisedimentorum]TCS41723.1 cell division protein FtsL [Reinekea marinisedimentorum]
MIVKSPWLTWSVVVVLTSVALATTFSIVSVTYKTRQQFSQLEQMREELRVMQEEWGKLLLEESAFSSPSRVERIAREQLHMVLPSAENIKEIDKLK